MIKLCFTLRRLPALSREEFQRYWREQHAPLVARHAKALRIHRYVQVHTLDHPGNEALRAGRGGPAEYDGIAELWWKSAKDLAAGLAEPEAQDASRELLEDERRFIDLANSPLWFAEENIVVDGALG